MLNAAALVLLALAAGLGCLIPMDGDRCRGRQVLATIATCLLCAALGATGTMA